MFQAHKIMTSLCLTISVCPNTPASFIITHATSLIGLKSLKMSGFCFGLSHSHSEKKKKITTFFFSELKQDFLFLFFCDSSQ